MTIDDTITYEKLQYDVNREAAKISALSSGKIDKYEYLTGVEILPFNPIQDGLFQGFSRMGTRGQKGLPLPKIFHTYPTMMKLGNYTLPKQDPKNI